MAIEVPAAETGEPPSSDGSVRASGHDDSLADCVERLRRAEDLPEEGEDRSFYDQAFAAEKLGELTAARKGYYQLVQNYPRSRRIPLAYLAFGELFAREAGSDPAKWDLAQSAFNEVAKYPPPDNTSYAYALLRLGDTQRERDDQRALGYYLKALQAGQKYPDLPCRDSVSRGARERLVDSYVRVGRPDRAWNFFRASVDAPDARAMLVELAERYRRAGKSSEVCAIALGAGSDPVASQIAGSSCP